MKLSAYARLAVPLTVGLAISIALLVFSEISHRRLNAANQALERAMETQAVAAEVLALVTDADSSLRGLLLTDQRNFLDPYVAALPKIDSRMEALRGLVQAQPEQSARVSHLRELVRAKLAELDGTLLRYRDRGPQAARAQLRVAPEHVTMEQIRREVDALTNSERAGLVQLSYQWNQDIATSRFGLALVTALNIILLVIVYTLTSREFSRREQLRMRLVEQKRALESEVRARTLELSELSTDLQRVQEAEKSQLARELHDEMGSILVSAKMDVSWALARVRDDHPDAAGKLKRALQSLDDGVEAKRRIVDDLRPALLDNLGLGAAITWHVEQMSERSGLHCIVEVPDDDEPLPGHIAIALFRIAQEALTNVVRHAEAANAWVKLERTPDEVMLGIRDDGCGLPSALRPTQRAHGIMGMRQRALGVGAQFDIDSPKAGGTLVRVRVVLGMDDKEKREKPDYE